MKLGRPRYVGDSIAVHGTKMQIGVLLANLGSPAAPTASGLRPYLRQFLFDPRVIELPRWLWWLILNGIIVPFRSPKSARAYQEVWTEQGSPLIAISQRQFAAVTKQLVDLPVQVALGMSYGEPSIVQALKQLHDANCRHLLVLPLYPQYAASTVGAVFDAVARELSSWRWVPNLRFVAGYCQRPDYIATLAASIQEFEQEHGQPDLTLFSFHGTQLAALKAGDPYHCHCHLTARSTADLLGWQPKQWEVTFQSRFGKDPWLQPYTIEQMAKLPQRGIKNLHVICPAFAADCLETLEEIAGENRDAFMAAGGERFSYIPALNDMSAHIAMLAGLIRENVSDWCELVTHANDPAQIDRREREVKRVKPLTEGKSD